MAGDSENSEKVIRPEPSLFSYIPKPVSIAAFSYSQGDGPKPPVGVINFFFNFTTVLAE